MNGKTGPIEEQAWVTRLDAHVVTPGASPRMHGYDVETELAPAGSVTEISLLATTGELPSKAAVAAARIALQFAAAVTVAEAPGHATVLAKLSGASVTGLIAIAATGLAEQARSAIEALGDWPERLAHDAAAPLPDAARARDVDDRSAALRLRAAVTATGLVVPALDAEIGRSAAIVAVLLACGVRGKASLVTLLVTARLPTLMAEASHVKIADFRSYPMDTPHFDYEAPR